MIVRFIGAGRLAWDFDIRLQADKAVHADAQPDRAGWAGTEEHGTDRRHDVRASSHRGSALYSTGGRCGRKSFEVMSWTSLLGITVGLKQCMPLRYPSREAVHEPVWSKLSFHPDLVENQTGCLRLSQRGEPLRERDKDFDKNSESSGRAIGSNLLQNKGL